ncbi:hypothetical protein KYC5002_43680 [Archangium violaceum]|uniref:hypothetical protein n=1 Tax=Archangium violaceum TaxID=83451 RepID=UPI002B31FDE5|nr:hypothetical protein KYC5002_43680 [Archangium gephyra]
MSSETQLPLKPPKDFRLEDDGQRATLTWRWYSTDTVALMIVSVFWTAFLLEKHSRLSQVELFFFGSVAVAFIYATMMGLLNSTRVEVGNGELRIQHGPLPFWRMTRSLTVSGSSLTQLFGEEFRNGKGGISYTLLALDTRGRKVKLVSRLENKEKVLYLERFLEHRLGIRE